MVRGQVKFLRMQFDAAKANAGQAAFLGEADAAAAEKALAAFEIALATAEDSLAG